MNYTTIIMFILSQIGFVIVIFGNNFQHYLFGVGMFTVSAILCVISMPKKGDKQ